MTAPSDDESPLSLLVACLREPARGRRRLPALVGLLEADDASTRLAAAWSCCLVAAEYSETVPYLVDRLAARLDDEASLELTHALDYLADRHPEAVEAAIDDRAEDGAVSLPETGDFTRNYYYDTEPERSGIGRIRLPGSDDPRVARTADERERPADSDDAAEGADDDESGASDDEEANPGTFVRRTADVSSIAVRSRFDKLHVLASRRQSRYSEDYDALVGRGAEEAATVLRVLNLPEEMAARPAFEAAAGDQLERWAAVDDHPHVVSLLDWGREPRPWLVTSFAGESLAEMDRRAPALALEDAIALAAAVARCHRSDVVHGAIDPENVAYPGDVLDANDQEPPLLNNLGFVHVYRPHTNPARLLDPRYAAPEYYDRRFGTVDAATDVYGLGAVVYRLYTGEPPATGTFESVKAAVTDGNIPVPSDAVADVPPAIDDVVAKAMAARKLRRYDTVEHVRQDLAAIREDGWY